MNLKFSFITPSFNQGRFIEKTIQSILTQKSAEIEMEYIVCDGGSNDETIEILKLYEEELSWVSEADNGQADAVNKGITMTKGDIIGWINSDDIYYPGAFKAVKTVFQSNPDVLAIYGDADHIDQQDRVIDAYPTEPWNYKRLIETCFLCQPAVFFRRSLVEKFGKLDDALNYCMDYELWLRYGRKVPFFYLPQKLAGSRLYQENKTLGQRVAVHREINDMFLRKFNRVPDKWIFAYAHITVEENLKLARTNYRENRRFVSALVSNSFWSFWHWKQWISFHALLRMLWWYTSANLYFLKIVTLTKRL
ncbi:MAG: glycosyltransferase family 2 protein [Cyanobacteria bacterium J06632_19]